MGMVITCLGISGSGKTVFLGSLLDSLHSPVNSKGGFFIADTKVKGSDVMRDTLSHKDISLSANLERIGVDGYKGFPSGTKSTTFRQFSLLQGREQVLDIGWLDYKGGLLVGEHSDKKEQEELYAFLDRSTAIVIYLDGYRIATSSSISQARRRVGAEAISKILSHFESSKEGAITNILIVLTQCDAIEDAKWVGSGDYALLKQRTKEVLGGFVEMINRNPLWHCGIVAVSAVGVGRNRRQIIKDATFNSAAQVDDEIIDEPDPSNIVEAFYWLVACEVAAQRKRTQDEIRRLNNEQLMEAKRVQAGMETERAREAEAEKARLSQVGMIAKFLERTFFEEERLASLKAKQEAAAGAWSSSQEGVAKTIQSSIFGASTQLAKYEGALQPLFNQSNNAVTRI